MTATAPREGTGREGGEASPPLWLVTTGEPLPVDGPDTRLLRTGIFFQELVQRGVPVHWWTTAFDHAHRRHRTRDFASQDVGDSGRLSLLPSPGYGASVSLRRLWDHRVAAKAFLRHARNEPAPAIVYCAYPTIAMSRSVVAWGRARGIPVVLDVRDLWPDVIWDTVFSGVNGRIRASALATLRGSASWALRNASAVIGLTDEYVDWALELAGRERTGLDIALPVTYQEHEPLRGEERDAGCRFWKEHGVELGNHQVVCFLGTVGRQFDFGPILDAARALAADFPALRFVLCGQGEGLEEARAASSRLENVLWPGWVDGPARQILLERAVAGLAPYVPSENFRRNLPNKPVEYFANGLPVLYSLDGVLHRTCTEHDCGVRYDPSSAGDLRGVVARLLGDHAHRDRMSRNARDLFVARFRSGALTDTLLDHARAVRGTR